MSTLLDEPRATLARHRRTIAIVVLVAVVLGVLATLSRDKGTYDGVLDPRNPRGQGAQALARVLADRGVAVDVVRGQGELLRRRIDGRTAVVVSNASSLGSSTLRTLRRQAQAAAAIVLVGPATRLAALEGLGVAPAPSGAVDAACDEPLVRGLTLLSKEADALRADGCFARSGGALLVHRDRTWLLAAPRALSNEQVLEEDDAAVALRLLGQQPRLVWYVADPSDLVASDGVGIGALLPRWLRPGLALLGLAVVALVLWRGRRLGPLVSEPVPVVVRAAESTRSRGRLYRRTGDREHAATILVAATRRRLAEQLGLPPGAEERSVAAAAAAARTGRDPAEVHALLATTTVPTDAGLARLGRRLAELENEVRS